MKIRKILNHKDMKVRVCENTETRKLLKYENTKTQVYENTKVRDY